MVLFCSLICVACGIAIVFYIDVQPIIRCFFVYFYYGCESYEQFYHKGVARLIKVLSNV